MARSAQMNLRVRPALKAKLEKLAKEDRRTLSAHVEKLLEDYVKSISQVGPEQDRPRAKQALIAPLLDLVEVAPIGLNAGDDRTPPLLYAALGYRRAQPKLASSSATSRPEERGDTDSHQHSSRLSDTEQVAPMSLDICFAGLGRPGYEIPPKCCGTWLVPPGRGSLLPVRRFPEGEFYGRGI